MKTYTFDELDERAKEAVAIRYSQLIDEELSKGDELETIDSLGEPKILNILFALLGWRFNEHGERIA